MARVKRADDKSYFFLQKEAILAYAQLCRGSFLLAKKEYDKYK